MQRKPQWDDWRCYRCNKRQLAASEREVHVTPSGMPVAVCSDCLDESDCLLGGDDMPAFRIITRGREVYILARDGAVLSRTDGPQGWDYDHGWHILGFATRVNAGRIVTLDEAADGADIGQGWVHDLDHGSHRMWGSPSDRRVSSIQRIDAA